MRSRFFVTLSLSLLFAAACTGGDDTAASPSPTVATPTTTPTATPTTTPTATPTSTPTPTVTPTDTATPDVTPTPPLGEARAIEFARGELDDWLGPLAGSVISASGERETWQDGCLGLGRPTEGCTQALVEGYRVTIAIGSATYEVRTDLEARIARWAPETQILVRFAEASTNAATFTTDDGSTIEVRLVPGTQFGADLATLAGSDPVGIAIVSAPQGGAPILVWVDPARE